MYPLQETAIFSPRDKSGRPARISCIEASTKSGKTYSGLSWIYEQALMGGVSPQAFVDNPRIVSGRGKHYWWVAPIYAQTEIAFRRMTEMLEPGTFHKKESPPTIQIFNDAVIDFKSGERPDGLYGQDVWAAVGDEASRWRATSWHALRSTLTFTRGPLRLIGNVKGRRNFFYGLSRRAEAGEAGMAYYKIIAADAIAAGILHPDEIEEARSQLPENVFKELYLAEASDDQGNPFGFEHIRACVGPMSTRRPVAFGVDLAKSQDWTVVTGIDDQGAVSVFERFQQPWPITLERIKKTCGMTPALVDSTGAGDPVLAFLQQHVLGNFDGYLFSAPSKQKLMESLAMTIQKHETRFPDKDVCPIRDELEVFEYSYSKKSDAVDILASGGWPGGMVKYSAPAGYHDDCVCVVSGTLVRTSRGMVPIEQVRVGHFVLTHRGRYRMVTKTSSRLADDVYRIDATGKPTLELSADHPLLAVKASTHGSHDDRRNQVEYGPEHWRAISGDLSTDHGLLSAAPIEIVDVEAIDFLALAPTNYIDRDGHLASTTYAGARQNPKTVPMRRFVDVDEDFCFLMGYYLAEGSTNGRHGVNFASHSREWPIRDRLEKYFNKLGLHSGSTQTSEHGFAQYVSSQALVGFLRGFGARSHKRLPAWVELLPPGKQLQVLIGYMVGDGNFTEGVGKAGTISATAAIQLYEIAVRVKLPFSLRVRRNGYLWSLSWGAPSTQRFLDQVSSEFIEAKVVNERNFERDQTQIRLNDEGHVIGRVWKIEPMTGAFTVHNLSVDEDESYTANGVIVHNCSLALAHECRRQNSGLEVWRTLAAQEAGRA
jgi:intein/homing endonuclease